MAADQPLRCPPHYPPTNRWKKFFIGVRWLGPDLSFFGQLQAQQKARTASSLDAWGGGNRQALAASIGVALSTHLRWPGPYFLPGDCLSVVFGGPRFVSIDGDLEIESAIADIEERLGISMERTFWLSASQSTMGELVDRLNEAGSR